MWKSLFHCLILLARRSLPVFDKILLKSNITHLLECLQQRNVWMCSHFGQYSKSWWCYTIKQLQQRSVNKMYVCASFILLSFVCIETIAGSWPCCVWITFEKKCQRPPLTNFPTSKVTSIGKTLTSRVVFGTFTKEWSMAQKYCHQTSTVKSSRPGRKSGISQASQKCNYWTFVK